MVCETCWQPLLPEDFSNSTELSLVTSLINKGKGSIRAQLETFQWPWKTHLLKVFAHSYCQDVPSDVATAATTTSTLESGMFSAYFKFMNILIAYLYI
jgi:hypothetical protein